MTLTTHTHINQSNKSFIQMSILLSRLRLQFLIIYEILNKIDDDSLRHTVDLTNNNHFSVSTRE